MERHVKVLDVVESIRVPASLLGVVHGRKHLRGESWILTTKSGVTIGDFPSEAELDNWWLTFQSSQGRSAKPCVKQEASHGLIYLAPEANVAPKAKIPPEVDMAREAMRTQQQHGNATPKASSSPLPTACKAPPNRAIGIAIFNQSRTDRPAEPDPQQTKASPTRSTPLPTAGKSTLNGGAIKSISITREKSKPAKNDHTQTRLQHHLNELSKRKLKLVKAVERVEAEQSHTGHVALDTTALVDRFAAASDACRDYWTLLRVIIDLRQSLPPSPLKRKITAAQQSVQPDKRQPAHKARKKRKKSKTSGAKRDALGRPQGQTRKKGSHRSPS